MKKTLGLVFIGLILAAGAGIFYFSPETVDHLKAFIDPDLLKTKIESFGVWAPLVFMAIYFSLALLFISAAAFTVLSGLLFGKLWGSIYVIIAATLAAQVGFYISRSLGGDQVHKLKDKKGIGSLISTLEEKSKSNGFRNLIVLRCLFLPYMPLSYAAGLIKTIKPRDFFFATLLTNMIFSPAFVFLGDSLLEGPKALILPVIMIILVFMVPKIVKKFQK